MKIIGERGYETREDGRITTVTILASNETGLKPARAPRGRVPVSLKH